LLFINGRASASWSDWERWPGRLLQLPWSSAWFVPIPYRSFSLGYWYSSPCSGVLRCSAT